MELINLTEQVKDSSFPVFANAIAEGGSVRCIVAKNAAATLTRKAIDKLTEQARGIGRQGSGLHPLGGGEAELLVCEVYG